VLSISTTPGKVFVTGETVDTAKLNQLGSPVTAFSGGLEYNQLRIDRYSYGTNGGAVNAYTLQLPYAANDRSAPLTDGTIISFKPTITNTAASTLTLVNSTGSTILATRAIKKRYNTALLAGDLVAGQIYEARYDGVNDVWQLISPWGAIGCGADLAPDQYFYVAGAGTALAMTGTASPAPTAYKAGMHVFLAASNTNTNSATTFNLNSLGALAIRKGSGSSNSVITAGDIVSGGVYLLVLEPSAGYWVLMNPTNSPKQAVCTLAKECNLVVSRTNATTVNIAADQLEVQHPTTLETMLVTSINVSPAITVAGANGLDTPAEAPSTWYYIWIIYNPATATTLGLFSTSRTAPTMPSGYTYKGLIGAVYNDVTSNFREFWQRGKRVSQPYVSVLNNAAPAAPNTYQALDISLAVPDTAVCARGYAGSSLAATGATIAISGSASAYGEVLINEGIGAAVMDGVYASGQFDVPVVTAHQIYWKSESNVTLKNFIRISGYDHY
jgi:hypothetical protein